MMGTSEKQKNGVKPYLLKALLAAVFVFGLTIFVHSTDVQAATKVTNVKQTKYNETAVQISYTAGMDDYMYYRIGSQSGVSTAKEQYYQYDHGYRDSTTSPYMQIGGLTAGNSYWVQVGSASSGDSSITWSDAIEVVTAPSAAPTNLKHTKSTKTSITVSWNAVTGANMYTAYRVKYGSTSSSSKNVTTNKVTFTGLTQGSAYGVQVIAARKSSTGFVAYASSYASSQNYLPTTSKKPTAPYLTTGYEQQGRVSVRIKKAQSFVDGYQFQIYDVGLKKVVVTKTTSGGTYATTISSSKLKNNDVYKVRVRGYIKDSNGKKYYGTWSSYSYFASQKLGTVKASNTTNGIKVSWNKVKGASKYAVYVSTKLNSGYKKVATTSKRSYVITKYGKTSLKSGTRYYFYVAPMAKVGKKYYSTNSNLFSSFSLTHY